MRIRSQVGEREVKIEGNRVKMKIGEYVSSVSSNRATKEGRAVYNVPLKPLLACPWGAPRA